MGVVATTTKPKGFFYYIMAENKKSIIVYADWMELFEALKDDEAGRLIKHFFRYVNDLDPKAPDRITELSFIQIKQSLKRDLKKYENYIEKQKANGLKGGRPKTQITQPFISKPKKADSDSDSDSDNVNDSDILIKEKEKFSNNLFNDPGWNEDICRMNKINSDILLKYLNKFDLKLKSELETKINKKEYASHFSRWLKIELEKNTNKNQKQKLTGAQAFIQQFENL